MSRLGELIKHYRDLRGYNQAEFAQKLHVTQSTVSDWENGISAPRFKRIEMIARTLDVPIDKLLKANVGGEDGDSAGLTVSEPTNIYTGNIASARPSVQELYTQVPFLSARAQAGIPTITYDDCRMTWIEETYPVYITNRVITNQHLVIEIIGESMLPGINTGTLVLAESVPKIDIKYESGGVYAVLYGSGRFVVKRIKTNSINTKKILTLHSDNETYGCIDVPAEEIHCMWRVLEKVKELIR